MTKKKFEAMVRKNVNEIQESELAFFRVSIIDLELVENKRNQGEALVQIVLDANTKNMCAVTPLYYFTSTSRKEEQLNRKVLIENADTLKLIKAFYSHLSKEVKNRDNYPEVAFNQIANKIIELYKESKQEFMMEAI